jgi:hypothetical protein
MPEAPKSLRSHNALAMKAARAQFERVFGLAPSGRKTGYDGIDARAQDERLVAGETSQGQPHVGLIRFDAGLQRGNGDECC